MSSILEAPVWVKSDRCAVKIEDTISSAWGQVIVGCSGNEDTKFYFLESLSYKYYEFVIQGRTLHTLLTLKLVIGY